jgi:uncharacterized membrane protein
MSTEMYSKMTTFVLVAAMAAVLITSATLAMTDDALAKHKKKKGGNSQSSVQVNNCGSGKCQNAGSQIQGDGNSVSISQSQ